MSNVITHRSELLFCYDVKDANPNKPMQAMKIVSPENNRKIVPMSCSPWYMLLSWSSRKVYVKDWSGANFFHKVSTY